MSPREARISPNDIIPESGSVEYAEITTNRPNTAMSPEPCCIAVQIFAFASTAINSYLVILHFPNTSPGKKQRLVIKSPIVEVSQTITISTSPPGFGIGVRMLRHKFVRATNRGFILCLFSLLFLPRMAIAFCHETQTVSHRGFRLTSVSAGSNAITIQWLGRAAFLLTSSRGTEVLMDPHGRGLPPEPIYPHVVTTSHLHRNHSFIWMASGNPIVLHGLNPANDNWNRIHRTIRDVSFYTVRAYHDSQMGLARGKNTIFVVSMDGICVAHLGDLGHLLDEAQLKMMGKIDVLLVPLGQGRSRITSEDAVKLVAQVKPRVAIPQHYRWEGYVDEFAQMFPRVRRLNGNAVQFSKETLSPELEIIVLKDTTEHAPRDDF